MDDIISLKKANSLGSRQRQKQFINQMASYFPKERIICTRYFFARWKCLQIFFSA